MNSAAGRAPTAIKASMCLDIQLFAIDIILRIMQRKTANGGFCVEGQNPVPSESERTTLRLWHCSLKLIASDLAHTPVKILHHANGT
ncbi:hypothetical protein NKK66_RS00090 [Escherichia coli]|uniref:Uncharacterized protein n=1 Tax=Escherichia coli TaxID=562 RepID=A0A0L6ZW41_ECOLX|nr:MULTISPECIES: hypothetical protein [Escherichia]EHQ5575509.1 hypothetical protein [Escherichia coli O2]EGO6588812.1 hypothetical protein [Escherichia coli]EGO7491015.1 hypothetical protein [Escherichia coli]EGO7962107.1 hypothetical protein [Escherichia coli]EGO7970605.1 hypothetical protein [Escherichia coli]